MSEIINKFDSVCNNNKEKIAMYYVEKNRLNTKTFFELHEDVVKMSTFLCSKGVMANDKILAFASSNYNLCVFILAAFKLGASVMYIDIFARQESIKNIFEKYKPSHILVSNRTNIIKKLFREINAIKNVINIDIATNFNSENIKFENIPENTSALITTTTGSTGVPKIFVRSHKDLLNQLNLVINNIENTFENEIILTTSYIYIFANILQGYATVLPNINLASNSNKKIEKKLSYFDNINITTIITSPDFCLKVDNTFRKLKNLYFGGAILNYNEAIKIADKYKNTKITYIYGSTECNLISKVDLSEYIYKLKSENICYLGQLCNGVVAKVDGNNHILVKSNALLRKTLDEISNCNEEFYDTNDIGAILDGNRLIYKGKNKFFINVNDNIIYSNEIEQKIVLNFRNITKCAVIQKSEKCYVFVENYDINKKSIKTYLKNEYGIDAEILSIRVIPKDVKHHTKINYLKLEKMLRRIR